MRPIVYALILVASCCNVGVASAPSVENGLFVAADGDDGQAGTRESPLRSLKRAQEVVRERLKEGIDRDITVTIRGGTYVLAEPLVFGWEDSAPQGHHVAYTAAPGEKVVISGGRPITGWRQAEEEWRAVVPEVRNGEWFFRELFAGGVRLARARAPNDGYFRVAKAGADDRTGFTFREGDLHAWRDVDQTELVFLHDWSTSRVAVAAVDERSHLIRLAQSIGPSAPHYRISHFEPHPRYFIENLHELLDAPGEWHLEGRTGTLTFLPHQGKTPETTTLIAPRLHSLVVVRGDLEGDRPVRGLRFSGLQFMHCGWRLPKGGYAAGQACFHEKRDGSGKPSAREMMPAALTFDRAEDCVVEDCRLAHLGGCGIHFRRTCRNNRISNCTVQDVAGNGIMIGETITRGSDNDLVSRSNTVAGNTIQECGAVYFGAVGIWVGIAADTTVADNEVCNLPYTGISVGWSWNTRPTGCRGNVVEHNHIHHVMQTLSDGGGIYTLGRQPGTVLRGNRIHDVPPNAGRAESNGIFMDQGSDQILVEENTIYGIAKSPIRFHQANKITLRGNRLVSRKSVPAFRYNRASPDTMVFEQNELVEAKNASDDVVPE